MGRCCIEKNSLCTAILSVKCFTIHWYLVEVVKWFWQLFLTISVFHNLPHVSFFLCPLLFCAWSVGFCVETSPECIYSWTSILSNKPGRYWSMLWQLLTSIVLLCFVFCHNYFSYTTWPINSQSFHLLKGS